jgi:hypothetical protein
MSWNIKTPGDYINGPLTVAGSATITGDLTVDTNVLKVDTTNNRVGIGTATPATTLDVAGAATITGNVTVKSGNALLLNRTDNLTSTQLYDSGSNGFIIDNLNTNGIRLMFNGVTALLLNSTGNLAFPDAKGIDFSAKTPDGSGTVGSEVLNDYEEGTWTGTIAGSTSNPTVTQTATGRYTKIGRVVNVTINFNVIDTSGAAGAVFITGLPFTNNVSNVAHGAMLSNLAITFTGSPFSFIEIGTTVIQILASSSNAAVTQCTHNAGAGRYIQATITYTV